MSVWANRKMIKAEGLAIRCKCCGLKSTHQGEADGRYGYRVIVAHGCELWVRRWVRDGYSIFEMDNMIKKLAVK